MKAAVVQEVGRVPVYADFREPGPHGADELIAVLASAVSPVARSRAAGRHYSGSGAVPFVAGVDGVGIRARDGRRVYFLMPGAPFGAMAERALVDASRVIALPDALDPVVAAAMAIPGMSSWAALVERAHLVAGETVLVNGATGASGRLAVQVARRLGAAKVVATGRDEAALRDVAALGADRTIGLAQEADALGNAFEEVFQGRVDIVLDDLWGDSAEALLVAAAKAGPDGVRIRYVQIGAASAPNITLPSAALRSSSLELLGSGVNSLPMPRLLQSIADFFDAPRPRVTPSRRGRSRSRASKRRGRPRGAIARC